MQSAANNEISKTYFSNSDWENKNLNSYTLVKLNNNYVNNKQSESIDFKIKKLKLDSGVDNDKLIKRYLNNFIREDDVIL